MESSRGGSIGAGATRYTKSEHSMNVREFATHLRALAVDVKQQGQDGISVDSFVEYLDKAIAADFADPSALELERAKATWNLQAEEYRARVETDKEGFKAVILAGQNALRTGFLLNGGASVALLAVISSFMPNPDTVQYVPSLADSLVYFVIGTLMMAVSSGFTYLSQWTYEGGGRWHHRIGYGLNILTIVIGLSSFGVFVKGMYEAHKVFQM